MSDYPQMLYRPCKGEVPADAVTLGEQECQTLVVADEDEHAMADGFLTAKEVLDAQKPKAAPKGKAVAKKEPAE